MFEDIREFFEGKKNLEDVVTDAAAVSARDLAIATCVLLVETAGIDQEIAKEEGDVVVEMVHREFGVPKKDIPGLITLAISAKKEKGKLADFVEVVGRCFTGQQKQQLLTMIWRVVLADGHIDAHEEILAEKLRDYLKLSYEQGLEAYQKAINTKA